MKRRDFISLTGMGAVRASWPFPVRATAWRYDEAEELAQEDPRFREMSGLIEEKMAEYRVPGVAFGLVKNGSLAMRGFGLTNLENPQPVTPDTIFPLASITKTITTIAMLRLVEQGSVDLDAPSAAVPAGLPGGGRRGHPHGHDPSPPDAHAWMGRSASEYRPR